MRGVPGEMGESWFPLRDGAAGTGAGPGGRSVTGVLLALTSAALFGAMSVFVRIGLGRAPEPRLANLATILPAAAIALAAAAIRSGPVGDAWPFALAGLLAFGVLALLAGRRRSAWEAEDIAVTVHHADAGPFKPRAE
jgi:drug/metabolite transporter (DMT)-like permease